MSSLKNNSLSHIQSQPQNHQIHQIHQIHQNNNNNNIHSTIPNRDSQNLSLPQSLINHPLPQPDNANLSFDYPNFSLPSPQLPPKHPNVHRHHRHASNASEASSNSAYLDSFSLAPIDQLSPSPVPSFDEPPTGSSSYVDEPLPMEGHFATLHLRASPNPLSQFLPPTPPVPEGQPLRYDTLSWAKEHAFPEPRQESILATGGIHPKSSVSSLTAMLESQDPHQQQQPQSQDPQQQQPQPFTHSPLTHSRRSSAQFSPLVQPTSPALGLQPAQRSSQSPSPVPEPGFSQPAQLPIITTPAPNPGSPCLRLNMNHPAMPNGPSISLTSATPLTAKPGQRPGECEFQRVLDDMVQAKAGAFAPLGPSPSLAHQPGGPQTFLHSRPPRSRQRSKSESIAKQQAFVPPLEPTAYLGSTQSQTSGPGPSSVAEFSSMDMLVGQQETQPTLGDAFWGSLSGALAHQQQPAASMYGGPAGWASSSGSASGSAGARVVDESCLQTFLDGFTATRRLGGPGYDRGFLKPSMLAGGAGRRAHSVSHGHRRGRSEGAAEHSEAGMGGVALGMPDASWVASFPLGGHGQARAGAGRTESVGPGGEQDGSSGTPGTDGRARSYSHASSFESFDSAGPSSAMMAVGGMGGRNMVGSGLMERPAEFKSRTTAATKAAAAKRRKEGTAARYMCEMCGETFTRRYNLRGHQRAHKGEKPFACGFPGCNSSFARAHDQKRHYKLHLGVKDYNCQVCRKTFIRLDALQRHHKSDAGQACYLQLQASGSLGVGGSVSGGVGGSSTQGVGSEVQEYGQQINQSFNRLPQDQFGLQQVQLVHHQHQQGLGSSAGSGHEQIGNQVLTCPSSSSSSSSQLQHQQQNVGFNSINHLQHQHHHQQQQRQQQRQQQQQQQGGSAGESNSGHSSCGSGGGGGLNG